MKISLYLDMANQIADTCSGCLRRKVGAIAISDTGQIIGAGYNTALSGYGNPKKCESCVRQDMNIPSGERHEICNPSKRRHNCMLLFIGLSIWECTRRVYAH